MDSIVACELSLCPPPEKKKELALVTPLQVGNTMRCPPLESRLGIGDPTLEQGHCECFLWPGSFLVALKERVVFLPRNCATEPEKATKDFIYFCFPLSSSISSISYCFPDPFFEIENILGI